MRVAVVKQVLSAKRAGHRQAAGLRKLRNVGYGLLRPAAAAQHQHRALRLTQPLGKCLQIAGAGRGMGNARGHWGGRSGQALAEHILGQR